VKKTEMKPSTKSLSASDRITIDVCMSVGVGLMGYAVYLMIFGGHAYSMMYLVGGLSVFLITLYWNDNHE